MDQPSLIPGNVPDISRRHRQKYTYIIHTYVGNDEREVTVYGGGVVARSYISEKLIDCRGCLINLLPMTCGML